MRPLFFAFAIMFSLAAKAQLPFQVGQPVIDGDGCPTGSVRAIVSPDGSAISILFDQFQVQISPGRYQMPQLRRSCHFSLPINVAAGWNLAVSQIDYRGFAQLEAGNRGFIITTGSLPGLDFTIGQNQLRSQLAPGTGNFLVSQPLGIRVRNRCLPLPQLEFTSIIHLLGPNGRGGGTIFNQEAMMAIDSADVGPQDAIRLNLSVTRCN